MYGAASTAGLDAIRLTRRQALTLTAIAGLGILLDWDRAFGRAQQTVAELANPAGSVPFYGHHQRGIATRSQQHLTIAAFDLSTQQRSDFIALLRAWSDSAASLTHVSTSRLTVTIGFGPSLFLKDGVDRFGLAALQPPALIPIPPFPGDQLDPARSAGDLCLQLCADDPQEIAVAFQRLHSLARGLATLRGSQHGFGPTGDGNPAHPTPRNLLGFKDGTDNIPGNDPSLLKEEVWVGSEGPDWMRGGTYMVTRRIRMHLALWNRQSIPHQQRVIGRYKGSGAPLGESHEFDPVNLDAVGSNGKLLIPAHAHIRLARSSGRRLLRRGYAFDDGTDPNTGERDAGLMFICFQRDIRKQFLAIQSQLAAHDALNRFITHTSSAVFACPPGARPGGYVGEALFGLVPTAELT